MQFTQTSPNGDDCSRFISMFARLGVIFAGALLATACSSTKPPEKGVAETTKETPSTPVISGPVTPPGETDIQRLERIIATLAANPIYFDYDNYAVKQQYQAALQKDFDALKTMPAVQIRLEGNADERGSAEYNLALGQKRAEAVRKALGILGMPDANVEAVSFGKEKPKAECHEEKCWAENRRVDFAVKR
jgi:peptidoglycan-associated lipoprotein